MPGPESDALVIFGISGDLAHKKIIPSIYSLVRRGRLTAPVLEFDGDTAIPASHLQRDRATCFTDREAAPAS